MSRSDELRKLLADEYNIHSDEELVDAYKILKASMDDFLSLFGKENHGEDECGEPPGDETVPAYIQHA